MRFENLLTNRKPQKVDHAQIYGKSSHVCWLLKFRKIFRFFLSIRVFRVMFWKFFARTHTRNKNTKTDECRNQNNKRRALLRHSRLRTETVRRRSQNDKNDKYYVVKSKIMYAKEFVVCVFFVVSVTLLLLLLLRSFAKLNGTQAKQGARSRHWLYCVSVSCALCFSAKKQSENSPSQAHNVTTVCTVLSK